jgi:predicted phosphodiesterase
VEIVLICGGHTHKPFINRDGTMVNLGSWVKEYNVHNTYLEIKNGKMTLNKFISKEEMEPIEPI